MSFQVYSGAMTVDLGDPFKLLRAFGAMAKVAGGDDYPELFSVPEFGEQEVEADWLAAVRAQAKTFLGEHSGQVGSYTREVLEVLAGHHDGPDSGGDDDGRDGGDDKDRDKFLSPEPLSAHPRPRRRVVKTILRDDLGRPSGVIEEEG